ncbi:hypothetical protein [Pseudomonas sp.]|uniref:hypothetical protein n=1 Tax=Pseudomonas sp. TaxID=306 RepID=UPI0026088A5A|nr:hypothetical protein [Pseudomonas sp.]
MHLSLARTKPRSVIVALTALLAMTVTAQAGHAATLPSLTLSASSSAITITGTPTSGAVNVIATSTGKLKEPSIVLVRLLPGATEAEAIAALENPKLDPNSVGKFGSIVFDAEATSGKGQETQTDLQPGSYLAVLAGENGPTKVHQSFTVAASPSPATLPAAQAQEKTIDFGFKGPSTLKVGELVGWEDGGYLVHMNLAFPVKNMAAAKKVIAGLKSGHEKGIEKLVAGPPVSFQAPVSPGGYQQSVITARPGIYVQVCFMSTQDGRPHTRLGMERIIRIAK